MATTVGSKIAVLVLRVIAFVLLFISLLVIGTASKTWAKGTEAETKITFKYVYAYRYMISTIIIGVALNLLQIAFTLYHVITKSDGSPLFDFCTDKFLSYFLLSGAAAGLGAGIDLKSKIKLLTLFDDFLNSFFDKANAAAALLLLAFVCSAAVSVLSSLPLIKKP